MTGWCLCCAAVAVAAALCLALVCVLQLREAMVMPAAESGGGEDGVPEQPEQQVRYWFASAQGSRAQRVKAAAIAEPMIGDMCVCRLSSMARVCRQPT